MYSILYFQVFKNPKLFVPPMNTTNRLKYH